jgi:Zn-dependent peptidase ImmA (M78 family)/transcriptional regulator with XRE-family HTH domain
MPNEPDGRAAFNPRRLQVARRRRGLTKEALAGRCGVTRRTATDWEAGKVENPPAEAIAEALGFPVGFFFRGDLDDVGVDAVSFRALTATTKRQVHKVLAAASLIGSFSSWMDENFRTPPPDVPSGEELCPPGGEPESSPVEVAESLRAVWGLGVQPVKDMLALLETRGVRIFGLPPPEREVDAFSYWHGARPLIFLNVTKSAELLRFDLAHELGHLCLHRGITTSRARRFEIDANAFASAFLMPHQGLVPQLRDTMTLADVFTLKRHWKVSATAMVRRLWQLGRITPWQYRSWMLELSQRGFRASEPGGLPHEQSSLLRKVMILARKEGWGLEALAARLGIPASELAAAVAGLTLTPVPGPGGGARRAAGRGREAPVGGGLHLVE